MRLSQAHWMRGRSAVGLQSLNQLSPPTLKEFSPALNFSEAGGCLPLSQGIAIGGRWTRGTLFLPDIPSTPGSSRWDIIAAPADEVFWSAAAMRRPIATCLMVLSFMMVFNLLRVGFSRACSASFSALSSARRDQYRVPFTR